MAKMLGTYWLVHKDYSVVGPFESFEDAEDRSYRSEKTGLSLPIIVEAETALEAAKEVDCAQRRNLRPAFPAN